ncbi:hypothetical protein ABTC48_20310, partial [Acinetobacter baumannii]
MTLPSSHRWLSRRVFLRLITGSVALGLIIAGVFAREGWFPSVDPISGKKTGWFGKELPAEAASVWNPLAGSMPTPTPQLSKEY